MELKSRVIARVWCFMKSKLSCPLPEKIVNCKNWVLVCSNFLLHQCNNAVINASIQVKPTSKAQSGPILVEQNVLAFICLIFWGCCLFGCVLGLTYTFVLLSLYLCLFLVSSVPMHNVHKMLRNRTMSMEDYDKPMRERKTSLGPGMSGSPTDRSNSLDHTDGASPPPHSPTHEVPLEQPLIEK